jgi:uncharacterized surface protein with fasciclin (FAS1) repeats
MRRLILPLTIITLSIVSILSSCNDEDGDSSRNIVELAQSDADLTLLVEAVQRAGLVGELSDESAGYTVFAPSNTAFNTFLNENGFSSIDDVPVDVLTDILLNHILVGKVPSEQIMTGYANTLATYEETDSNVDMYIDATSGVVINGGPNNGGATVTFADRLANNGIVHVVNSVIEIPKVPLFAAANPNYSILVEAMTRVDLSTNYVDYLSAVGPFTVFLPDNDAFEALYLELPNVSELADIDAATLESVLTYHVASGNTLSEDLTDGMMITTAHGGSFTVNISASATITDGAGRQIVIEETDIQGSNGVAHAISRVMLPS